MVTHHQHPDIDYAAHGFSRPFGDFTERKCSICVVIVQRKFGSAPMSFGVYLRHGTPGGAFWKSSPPLVERSTMEQAREVAAQLYGITGSGDFAAVVHDGLSL